MGDRCPACSASLHEECYGTIGEGLSGIAGDECCCASASQGTYIGPTVDHGNSGVLPESPLDFQARLSAHYADDSDVGEKESWQKDAVSIRDEESTGRKRAVLLYPITDGMVCEWAGLKNAGGGVVPLVGCRDTKLAASKNSDVPGLVTGAVHHGPDKDTLNNSPENVHRICTFCHNRWHTLNDGYYPDKRPGHGQAFIPLNGETIPHDAETQATETDYFVTDAYWNMPKKQRQLADYRKGLS